MAIIVSPQNFKTIMLANSKIPFMVLETPYTTFTAFENTTFTKSNGRACFTLQNTYWIAELFFPYVHIVCLVCTFLAIFTSFDLISTAHANLSRQFNATDLF